MKKPCRDDLEKDQPVVWLQKHKGHSFRTRAKVRSVSDKKVCLLVKYGVGWKRRYVHPADVETVGV